MDRKLWFLLPVIRFHDVECFMLRVLLALAEFESELASTFAAKLAQESSVA